MARDPFAYSTADFDPDKDGVPDTVTPTAGHSKRDPFTYTEKDRLLGEGGKMVNPGPAKQPALGTGKRFAALKGTLAKEPGVTDPAALAASIGRKKFGADTFAALGAAGKRRR